jgi:hypothetical protein
MLPWHEVREAREWNTRLSALRLLGLVMNGDMKVTSCMCRLCCMWRVGSRQRAEGNGLIERSSVLANARIHQR